MATSVTMPDYIAGLLGPGGLSLLCLYSLFEVEGYITDDLSSLSVCLVRKTLK